MNQISNSGYTYDPAGNLTAIPGAGGETFAYNAESQNTETAGVTYTYDGDGNRVKKSSGTLYWYGAGSEVLEETTLSGTATNDYIFFGGRRIARRDASGNIFPYFADHLGSSRKIEEVAAAGSTASPCYDADFSPYGREHSFVDSCPQNYKFTGKERDGESGLDYFGARYYSSSIARWLSPDWSAEPVAVPFADLTDPQTLNLYGYVRGNPLGRADADGHCCDLSDIVNFVAGVANAYASDNLLGAGRVEQTTTAGKAGAAVGDAAATLQGGLEVAAGGAGEGAGVALDSTGVGAVVGVPVNVVSAGVIAHGATTSTAGFTHLLSSAIGPKEGESGGPGAGKDFSGKTKGQAAQENKTANGGDSKCVFCGERVGPGTDNKINIDHAQAKANGGNNGLNNANVTCEYCNKSKGTGRAPKNPKKPDQN